MLISTTLRLGISHDFVYYAPTQHLLEGGSVAMQASLSAASGAKPGRKSSDGSINLIAKARLQYLCSTNVPLSQRGAKCSASSEKARPELHP
jgi:hypothetical protein